MPEHVLMSEIEIITDGRPSAPLDGRRELRIVEETMDDRPASRSWRAAMAWRPTCCIVGDGSCSKEGVSLWPEDDDVTSNKVVRQLEERIRELERQLGRKTLEAEILREALEKSKSKKNRPCSRGRRCRAISSECRGRNPGRARSHLIDRLKGRAKPRRRYQKAQDAAVVPLITASCRPPDLWLPSDHGDPEPAVAVGRPGRRSNHKRVYRIMQAHNLLLARKYSERPEHVHDGKVIVMLARTCAGAATGSSSPLERRHRPRRLHHRCPRPRDHRLARRGQCRDLRLRHIRDIMLEAVECRFAHIVPRRSSRCCSTTARPTSRRTRRPSPASLA